MGATTPALGLLMVLLPDPAAAQQPDSGEAYFEPSLARTASGGFIPAKGAYERRLLPGMSP